MEYLSNVFSTLDWANMAAITSSSYLLIFAAEIGDKSQLVCMVLATRYRALPVLFGATLAFVILNTLAVTFGVAIANWVPEVLISAIVAVLFMVFGIQALRVEEEEDDGDTVKVDNHRSIFITTLLLISFAEFGDKTQLAVVALSSTSVPLAVWLGSTLALISTSALGVLAGRTILQRVPISLLHRISGVIFIILALYASYNTFMLF
jgi:Ca2+/H+ antiporter, TMEM165/GDT1 family